MILINFVLVREGVSDDGLLPHLRELVLRAGADEVTGTSRGYTGSTVQKLGLVAGEPVSPDLVFVHRDADSADHQPRYDEIADAADKVSGGKFPVIGVVPVFELEAWLLLDGPAIRSVVGRPNGKLALALPSLAKVEKTSQPKEILASACLKASEKSGRRYEKERRLFSQRRRALLERLDIDGPIMQLQAWQRLKMDVAEFMARKSQRDRG